MNRLITFILLFFSIQMHAQKYIGKKGQIGFFSKAPIEDISAVNNNVSAVYDSNTGEIVFQLKITDFIFPKKLMQEHFNENYLESDILILYFKERLWIYKKTLKERVILELREI